MYAPDNAEERREERCAKNPVEWYAQKCTNIDKLTKNVGHALTSSLSIASVNCRPRFHLFYLCSRYVTLLKIDLTDIAHVSHRVIVVYVIC